MTLEDLLKYPLEELEGMSDEQMKAAVEELFVLVRPETARVEKKGPTVSRAAIEQDKKEQQVFTDVLKQANLDQKTIKMLQSLARKNK